MKMINSIRFRLTAIFFGVMVVLMLINIYIYMNVNGVIANIDKVYVENFTLNLLQDELQNIQDCMTEYLENKNTDSVENYYRHVQGYQDILQELNSETVAEEYQLMEKNICNMSKAYIILTDETIELKRGRDVEKYKVTYAKALKLSSYLNTYIESLNNSRFRANSANYQSMLSVLRYTQRLSIVILIIASMATVVLISVATRQITRPLTILAATANKVAEGNLDIDPVVITTEDEVGVVTKAFNKMLYSIREYIERIKENMERERALQEKELLMEAHLKEAQLNYLQAQINPHFLFNTLNAGAQLAMMEYADKTYMYIQNVADFFRYNVQNNKVVYLCDEIELVDSYMYIINVRYSGDIHYTKNIDDELTSIMVPAMIIQPLVENAVKYGVSDISWEPHIEISVSRQQDNIIISVKDNGIGMPNDIIESIFNESSKQIEDKDRVNSESGVGLKNVISRLRLYYDREEVMRITSDGENQGTDVAIIIPMDGGI